MRGQVEAQLLLHRDAGNGWFQLRCGTTVKIIGNFYVVNGARCCDLKPFFDSGKSSMWLALICSAGETEEAERLALKYASREFAGKFKVAVEEAKVLNSH